MTWNVYVLECNDGSLYTGITTDIERRVAQHNGEVRGGSKYTRAKRPVKVVFSRAYKTRSEATKEEMRIKKLTHTEKELLLVQK